MLLLWYKSIVRKLLVLFVTWNSFMKLIMHIMNVYHFNWHSLLPMFITNFLLREGNIPTFQSFLVGGGMFLTFENCICKNTVRTVLMSGIFKAYITLLIDWPRTLFSSPFKMKGKFCTDYTGSLITQRFLEPPYWISNNSKSLVYIIWI